MSGAGRERTRLYLITPPRIDPVPFSETLAKALDAGDAACLQLRLKEVPEDEVRRAAEILLPRDELALDRLDGLLLGAEFAAQGFELLLRLGEALGDGDVFLPRVTDAFLGLVDIAEGLRVLRLQLAEPLLVELDTMLVVLRLALEFEALLPPIAR